MTPDEFTKLAQHMGVDVDAWQAEVGAALLTERQKPCPSRNMGHACELLAGHGLPHAARVEHIRWWGE